MTEAVALDSGPLGRLAHPARNPAIAAWLEALLEAGIPVVIPEIVDYEGATVATENVGHLDQFVPALRLSRLERK